MTSDVTGQLLSQKSEVPPDYDKHDPEQKQIYRFVRTLFSAAQLTAECAIVTLVSVGYTLSNSRPDLKYSSWKTFIRTPAVKLWGLK